MKIKFSLSLLSAVFLAAFVILSYTVAKEIWQQIDFDTTVKVQNHISRRFDVVFSYFSLLGSVELTFALAGIFALFCLFRKLWLGFLGWLLIIPASMAEIFGKLVLFHPAPPVLFERSILPTQLPSFYIHTNFSYPSGHITRTIFLLCILAVLAFFWINNGFKKYAALVLICFFAALMILTRIYLGEHWLSDVLGGLLIGLSAGFFASVLIVTKK